jgi:hypothetical protein
MTEDDMTANVDTTDIQQEIAALRRMTVKDLRKRHLELFGEDNRSGNRRYLFRRIAWRLQALAEGDLSERARQRAQELARDADLRSRAPKELDMAPAPADLKTVTGKVALSRDERLPMPGTVLKRVFKGHEYHVTVLPNGFEYDGQAYRSLSAVAHAITGSHWNGWLFFGLATPTPTRGEEAVA